MLRKVRLSGSGNTPSGPPWFAETAAPVLFPSDSQSPRAFLLPSHLSAVSPLRPPGPPAETNARRFEKAPLTVQRQQTYSLWIPFQSYPRPCLPARVDNKLSCATRWQKQVPEKEERRRSGRSSSLSQCSPAPRSRSGRQCVPTAVSVGREERCQLPRRSCFEIPPSSFTAPWAVNPRWESQNQTPVSEEESFPLAGACDSVPFFQSER